MKKHRASHHPEEMKYTCNFCDKVFDSSKTFECHQLEHELKATVPTGIDYVCFICNASFDLASDLEKHFNNTHWSIYTKLFIHLTVHVIYLCLVLSQFVCFLVPHIFWSYSTGCLKKLLNCLEIHICYNFIDYVLLWILGSINTIEWDCLFGKVSKCERKLCSTIWNPIFCTIKWYTNWISLNNTVLVCYAGKLIYSKNLQVRT